MKRNITVVSAKMQSTTNFTNVEAETLADLKILLDEANIDYNEMAFYEGYSKTELCVDESLLPNNMNYKGTITNDLVIMLSQPKKKIQSGMDLNRKECFNTIKQNQELADFIKNEAGKNYTQVKTELLNELITKFFDEETEESCGIDCEDCGYCVEVPNMSKSYSTDSIEFIETVYKTCLDTSLELGIIDKSTYDMLITKGEEKIKEFGKKSLSQKEIDDMFNFLN